MFNILVPTDFSELSKIAAQFGIQIANQHNGNITLLLVVPITQTISVTIRERMQDIEGDLVSAAGKELEKLMR